MKERIVWIMEGNPYSGYFVSELSIALCYNGFNVTDAEIRILLMTDNDFFYDNENVNYVGWRLTKYR